LHSGRQIDGGRLRGSAKGKRERNRECMFFHGVLSWSVHKAGVATSIRSRRHAGPRFVVKNTKKPRSIAPN
jgi:hypothetical protein